MRTLGWLVLCFGIVLGSYALNMDTSVDTGGMFGRVNNIGLMNDKQNYLMISAACFIGGLLMALLDRGANDAVSPHQSSANTSDPFDEIDAEALNERKRYAIRLGIRREGGQYWYNDVAHADLEEAIQSAENARGAPDAAEHFLG